MLALIVSWERINSANDLSYASAADAIRVKRNTQDNVDACRRGASTKVKPLPNRFVPLFLFLIRRPVPLTEGYLRSSKSVQYRLLHGWAEGASVIFVIADWNKTHLA
jgi:hypothetical protein